MGLGFLAATFILGEHRYRPIKGRVLTIGRQTIGVRGWQLDKLLEMYGIPKRPGHVYTPDGNTLGVNRTEDTISQESFFGAFTDAEVRSLDVSNYEGADIVCDLQGEVPPALFGTADFIYNGSCLDNIFDAAAAMRNMTRLLKVGGRVYHYEQGNTHPTAYLKYSADWFMDFYAVNKFADCKTYVCGPTAERAAAGHRPGHPVDDRALDRHLQLQPVRGQRERVRVRLLVRRGRHPVRDPLHRREGPGLDHRPVADPEALPRRSRAHQHLLRAGRRVQQVGPPGIPQPVLVRAGCPPPDRQLGLPRGDEGRRRRPAPLLTGFGC